MNNRIFPSPILPALALTFSFSSFLLHADDPMAAAPATATTNATPAPAAATPAPAPTVDATAPASVPDAAPTENPATYTVVSGDTLWDLANKFHTSVKKLKKLNHLTKKNLKPGQVLKIPPTKASAPAPVKTTSTTHHKKSDKTAKTSAKTDKDEIAFHARHAEPVQDFDMPASTLASCPVPIKSDDSDTPTPKLAEDSNEPHATMTEIPVQLPPVQTAAAGTTTISHVQPPPAPRPAPQPVVSAPALAGWATPVSSSKPAHHGFFGLFETPAPVDWGTRFTQAARDLGNRGLDYCDDWRPPGESRSWSMDCSNTTRYLYKETAGIELPRTASDQYYYLHLQNKAWDVPQTSTGFADCNYLRENLKPGDLLFWENTYKPERQPPITHVMVFLGTNARGQWIMAGSQSSRGGEHNRSHGGPDIYVFNPTRPCGGYSTWMGLVHHQGRFCAYGRPLEADRAKLAVAAND